MIYGYFIENVDEKVYRDNSPIFRTANRFNIHEDDLHMDCRDDKSDFESLLSKVKAGDTVYVRSIFDISNSIQDLLRKLQYFNDMDINLISLTEPFYSGEANKDFINLIVNANAYYKQWAQEWGLLRAKEAGKLGRPKNGNVENAVELYKKGISLMDVLKLTGVSKSTFFRAIKEAKNTNS